MFDWAKRFWAWLHAVDLSDDVAAVRQITVELCGFLPTVQTVVNILALGNPALLTANAVATAICRALSRDAQQTRLFGGPPLPTVEGVVIEGEWTKKD